MNSSAAQRLRGPAIPDFRALSDIRVAVVPDFRALSDFRGSAIGELPRTDGPNF